MGRALGILAAAAAGVVAGTASVALYATDWGLVLLTVCCLGALLLAPAGPVRGAGTAGWTVAVLLAARGGPGGDVVVSQDVRVLFLLVVAVTLIGVAAATWPRDRESRPLSSAP